jgi:hypothetical protein
MPGRSRRPQRRLYFDSSVYGFTHDSEKRNPGEVERIRRWLRSQGWDLVVSDEANLGEAIAISSADDRAERVRLIMRLANWTKPPIDLVMTEEVFNEIARHERGWVRMYMGQRDRKRYLDFRGANTWERLQKEPTAAHIETSPDLRSQLNAIEKVLTDNKMVQKERRHIRRVTDNNFSANATDPELQRALNALPPREMYWRVHMFQDYTVLLQDARSPSAETDWLPVLLDLDKAFADGGVDWQRFWVLKADPGRMPANYLYVAGLYCQEEEPKPADRGSSVDRIHLCYLHQCDAVVTTDGGLYKTMVCALRIAPSRGVPIFLNRSAASALAELQRCLPAA